MIGLETERSVKDIRSAADRWKQVDRLLSALQRLVQVNAIIDVEGGHGSRNNVHAVMFDESATELEKGIDEELSALTVELLASELKVKKMKGRK